MRGEAKRRAKLDKGQRKNAEIVRILFFSRALNSIPILYFICHHDTNLDGYNPGYFGISVTLRLCLASS